MTVLTKLKVSKHEDEPALTQLVSGVDAEPESAASADAATDASVDEVDAETAARYRVLSQRARRINGSNLCACTAMIAVLALCLLCVLFYYRHHREERVHAWCSLPYEGETNNDDLLMPSDAQLFGQKAPTKEVRPWDVGDRLEMLPMFHEEFDIDLRESTEEMFVPRFERGMGARFMAHFHLGEMVILPTDTRHCLTMELNRDDFLEPQALAAQVRRMENGETLPEALSVRREVLTVRSAPTEPSTLSAFTLRACSGRPAFALHRRLMFKREAEGPAGDGPGSLRLAVYAGRRLIEYVLTDLPAAE